MDTHTEPAPGSDLPPVATQDANGQQTAPAPSVPVADDASDQLDQEWVEKAKAIVEQTKNDPFKESQELSKAKSDYLKIRYNKHIKVAEDNS